MYPDLAAVSQKETESSVIGLRLSDDYYVGPKMSLRNAMGRFETKRKRVGAVSGDDEEK